MKSLRVLLILILGTANIHAKELQTVSSGDWQVSLAAGYGVLENPRAKVDNVTTWVLPSWYYYGDNFYIENFTLGYSLYETDWVTIDIQGQLNDDGLFFEFDGINRLFVADILGFTPIKKPLRPNSKINPDAIERKISYMGGVSATWYTPAFDMTTGLLYDVTDVHNGYEWQLSFKKALAWSWGAAGVEVGGVYKSEQLVEYYYGIHAKEFLTKVLAYQSPDATSNWYFKMVVNIPISDNLTMVASAKHTWLGDEIRDSILIAKDDYFAGFIGISYGF